MATQVQGIAVDERGGEEQRRDRDPVGVEVPQRNPERIGNGLRLKLLGPQAVGAERGELGCGGLVQALNSRRCSSEQKYLPFASTASETGR